MVTEIFFNSNHSREDEITTIIIHYESENENLREEELDNWKLILSNSCYWMWIPDESKLEKVNMENVRLLERREKKYKSYRTITKKHLVNPLSQEELMKELEFKSEVKKKKVEETLNSSTEKNFYLCEWGQNGIPTHEQIEGRRRILKYLKTGNLDDLQR